MDSNKSFNTKNDIANLIQDIDMVTKEHPDATLGSALSKVDSSHQAVFVYDDNGKFLGLASPYRALYTSYHPYTAKVSTILLRPPAITPDAPVYEVAEHMVSVKIYQLPVFGVDGEPIGVINGKDILQHIAQSPELLESIVGNVTLSSPITAPISAKVNDIYQLQKEKGVSRVLLVEDNGSLAGMVSRSDLMQAFIKPTEKRRFPPEGAFSGFHSRAGEKKYREDHPARSYAGGLVDTLPATTPRSEIVEHLIASPHNSIILVDGNNRPTGFLSTRDLLLAVSQLRPVADIPLIMAKPDMVYASELDVTEEYLVQFGKKLQKRMAIEKIEVTSEEIKNTKGQVKEFDTTLIVVPVAGEPLVASGKQRRFFDSVQEAAGLIEKQRKRSGLSQRETRRHLQGRQNSRR